MKVPHALDAEFKRVAKEEGVPMEALVNEVAGLTGKSARQIYNFRSGKWVIPHNLFPILCKRFRSMALVNALVEECSAETEIEVPELYELTRLVSNTVRDDLKHYETFLDAFEDGVIDKAELDKLTASGERVIRNIYQFQQIAVADYERRCRFQNA